MNEEVSAKAYDEEYQCRLWPGVSLPAPIVTRIPILPSEVLCSKLRNGGVGLRDRALVVSEP